MAKIFGDWPFEIQPDGDIIKMIFHPKSDKATNPKLTVHTLRFTKSEFKILKEAFKLS